MVSNFYGALGRRRQSLSYLSEKEESLIGRLILDPDLAPTLGLSPEYFYNHHCREVYSSILHLLESKNSVDEISLVNSLKGKESFWLGKITEYTVNAAPSGSEVAIAEYITEEYIKRQTCLITSEAGRSISSGIPTGDVIANTIEALEGLTTLGKKERQTLAEDCREEIDALLRGKKESTGLLTGLGIEKVVPGGIPRDKVTVLFGETGTFKTTLKGNLVDYISRSGLVLDFSLEDSSVLSRQRALARSSSISYSDIATGDVDNNIDFCVAPNYQNVITIDNVWPPTAEGIIREARKYRKDGLVAVFIDYITLLDWGGGSERAMLNSAMLAFQRAAKRDKIAYIVVSQINDERLHDRSRQDARPKLRDLFGSSSLRTACKLAIATYRPGKYGPPTSKYDKELYGEIYANNPEVYDDIIELWIRKNVLGEDNVPVYVTCNRKTGKMKPLSLEDLYD